MQSPHMCATSICLYTHSHKLVTVIRPSMKEVLRGLAEGHLYKPSTSTVSRRCFRPCSAVSSTWPGLTMSSSSESAAAVPLLVTCSPPTKHHLTSITYQSSAVKCKCQGAQLLGSFEPPSTSFEGNACNVMICKYLTPYEMHRVTITGSSKRYGTIGCGSAKAMCSQQGVLDSLPVNTQLLRFTVWAQKPDIVHWTSWLESTCDCSKQPETLRQHSAEEVCKCHLVWLRVKQYVAA